MLEEKEHINFWAGEPYSHVLGQVITALSSKESLVAVTAEPGMGKTALARELQDTLLNKQDAVIYLEKPPASNTELQKLCCRQHPELERFAFMVALEKWLLQLSSSHRSCVLIVDDAHLLNAEVVTTIRIMNNLQSATHRLMQVVLLGEPNLLKVLNQGQSGGLTQRISLHAEMQTMNKAQLKQMMFDLFELTFETAALSLLFNLSEGKPGVAVDVGRGLNSQTGAADVTKKQLLQAVNNHPQLSRLYRSQKRKFLMPSAVVLLITSGLIGFYFWQQQNTTVTTVDVQPSSSDKAPGKLEQAEQSSIQQPTTVTAAPTKEPATTIAEPGTPKQNEEITQNNAEQQIANNPAQSNTASTENEKPQLSATDITDNSELPRQSNQATDNSERPQSSNQATDNSEQPQSSNEATDNSEQPQPSNEAADNSEQPQPSNEAADSSITTTEVSETNTTIDMDLPQDNNAPSERLAQSNSLETSTINESEADSVKKNTKPKPLPIDAFTLVPVTDDEHLPTLDEALHLVLQSWVEAWQDKDIDGYFASYTRDFKPTNGANHNQWRNARIRRILAVPWIKLSLYDLKITNKNKESLTIQVWLNYASPNYQDHTLKELEMVLLEDRWLIASERNKLVKQGELTFKPKPSAQ